MTEASATEGEPELLRRAREGDAQAFGALVARHEARVHACARALLGDPREAEDVAQEVFIRAHRALDRVDPDAGLAPLLHRLCVNAALHALRRRRERRFSPPPPPAEPGGGGDGVELRRRIAAARRRLPPSLRVACVLVLVVGLSHAEAAGVLGTAEETVAWRVHAARARLRELLVGQAGAPGSTA